MTDIFGMIGRSKKLDAKTGWVGSNTNLNLVKCI
jgi:hypothetical protein